MLPEVAFALGTLFSALPAVMALEPGAGGSGGTVPRPIPTAGTSAAARHAEWTACGLTPGRIQAFDAKGIPLVCATGLVPAAAALQSRTRMGDGPTLPETRGWEAIPGVLRADDADTCILEVEVGSAVRRVELIPNVPAPADTELRDDGQGADRIAGDGVYTIGPLGGRSTAAMPPTYCWDPNSPAGVDTVDLGRVLVVETDGSTNEFLVEPAVGMLRTEVALVPTLQLSSTIQRSAHVINLRSSSRTTQSALRFLGGGRMADLTAPLYAMFPDAFDFLVFFSSYRIERLPRLSAENFNAGMHQNVRVNYHGTGLFPFDSSAAMGSGGRLLGMNVLDACQRGIWGANVTHELMHQWSAYIDFAFGLKADGAHYSPFSSVGSIVGGFRWTPNVDGSFSIVTPDEGRNGGYAAAPLDRYLMGLIPAEAVPPLYAYGGSFKPPGNVVQPQEIVRTVSIDEILAVHGARSPGPDAAQRSFTIACVVESRDRLLTPCEMTFYELFAEHLARVLPEEAPAPFVTYGWQPIHRYFGEGTSWTTRLPASYLENPPPPRLIHIEIENEDVRLTWQTLAGVTNQLEASASVAADGSTPPHFEAVGAPFVVPGFGLTTTNQIDPGSATRNPTRFYRVRESP